jgi:hypothetical protein
MGDIQMDTAPQGEDIITLLKACRQKLSLA